MATMTYRTTFALDEATMKRIRGLSALWNVSQAEVVRRAVSVAQSRVELESPSAVLQKFLNSGGGLSPSAADNYLDEIREDRKSWRGE